MYTHTPTYERISDAQAGKPSRESLLSGFSRSLQSDERPSLFPDGSSSLEMFASAPVGTTDPASARRKAGEFA
ncbi:hypothetical protein [Natrinema halophilum]|uniref:Uncharacterized protein n=1 Tax=Natrinema halophilum TaxID=1699371 RepID=A0A7D5KCK7_9EURY|nr:hypothetical protein [Natrinema halophilum]QLG48701.1 hypothetical protein HYG82_07500 [Natrinema halophilum]